MTSMRNAFNKYIGTNASVMRQEVATSQMYSDGIPVKEGDVFVDTFYNQVGDVTSVTSGDPQYGTLILVNYRKPYVRTWLNESTGQEEYSIISDAGPRSYTPSEWRKRAVKITEDDASKITGDDTSRLNTDWIPRQDDIIRFTVPFLRGKLGKIMDVITAPDGSVYYSVGTIASENAQPVKQAGVFRIHDFEKEWIQYDKSRGGEQPEESIPLTSQEIHEYIEQFDQLVRDYNAALTIPLITSPDGRRISNTMVLNQLQDKASAVVDNFIRSFRSGTHVDRIGFLKSNFITVPAESNPEVIKSELLRHILRALRGTGIPEKLLTQRQAFDDFVRSFKRKPMSGNQIYTGLGPIYKQPQISIDELQKQEIIMESNGERPFDKEWKSDACKSIPQKTIDEMASLARKSAIVGIDGKTLVYNRPSRSEAEINYQLGHEWGAGINVRHELHNIVEGDGSSVNIPRMPYTIGTYHTHTPGYGKRTPNPNPSPGDIQDMMVHDDKILCIGAAGYNGVKIKCFTPNESVFDELHREWHDYIDEKEAFNEMTHQKFHLKGKYFRLAMREVLAATKANEGQTGQLLFDPDALRRANEAATVAEITADKLELDAGISGQYEYEQPELEEATGFEELIAQAKTARKNATELRIKAIKLMPPQQALNDFTAIMYEAQLLNKRRQAIAAELQRQCDLLAYRDEWKPSAHTEVGWKPEKLILNDCRVLWEQLSNDLPLQYVGI